VDGEKKKAEFPTKSNDVPLTVAKEPNAKSEEKKNDLKDVDATDVPKEPHYLDNFDFDAPVEVCGCKSHDAPTVDDESDDFLPPEERVSSFRSHFWNRFLRGLGAIDLEHNKENIFHYFDKEDPETAASTSDIDGVDRDLADLQLVKLPYLD